MQPKVLIVVGDASETLDTMYPYYRLIEAGFQPVVAAPEKRRYAPVRHVNASIREGRWKLYWPGDGTSLKKDSGRDNPSYLRGVVKSLAAKHDAWFSEVIADWQQSRAHIVEQDRA